MNVLRSLGEQRWWVLGAVLILVALILKRSGLHSNLSGLPIIFGAFFLVYAWLRHHYC